MTLARPMRRTSASAATGASLRRLSAALLLVLAAAACRTTAPQPKAPEPDQVLRGVASWYGEEFAGRTTANGEIFDPQQLTAAHRTLPFGTVLDVTNTKTSRTVRVRINDRGPFIENRIIDLSWAAAREIGLVDDGVGDVYARIVKVGAGEREPPVPFDVTVAEAAKSVPVIAPQVLPDVNAPPRAPQQEEPVVVDKVDVEVQRSGQVTRRVVAADGTSFEEVPVEGSPSPARSVAPLPRSTPRAPGRTAPAPAPGFYVQVGAFASEPNADALRERLVALGHDARVDHSDLYRVRIGPFRTRDDARRTQRALETSGVSAIIVSE